MTTSTVHDRTVPGPHGPVPIRVYHPADARGVGLVWLHGGAFHLGDLDMPEADATSRAVAGAGITVVSVDYRLAVGGVRFPVPSDDVLAAWTWAATDRGLDVPAERWHLGGGSAGGNLAASVALQARDGGGPLPRSSVLLYPVLHDVLPEASSELEAKLAALPPEARFPPGESRRLNLSYVGDEELLHHPYAFPAHGRLEGLPPSLVINADHDELRPSGEAYAAALALAGVDVTLVREVGTWHGYLNDPSSLGARRSVARMVGWLTREDLLGEAHEPVGDRATAQP